ncbi:hypothetical protein [Phenylobacterium immobile]|uniref:hypothetical protein n=1 Tax=Phenylobacterium immobile TaxID=21 RepID=UPI000A48522F|nr:hypothetical protein [Phenylobacterium immobile]
MKRLALIAAFALLPLATALAQSPDDTVVVIDAPLPVGESPPAEPVPPTVDTVSLQPVETTVLAAPDAFSTPGRTTGLPQDLWRGASIETAKAVLPLIAAKPVSQAARQLARHVLATGAPGPQGSHDSPGLAGDRAAGLLALGDVTAAKAVLANTPGLDRNSDLSHAAAEAALLSGDDARACAIADALGVGRDEVYWLRLRAFCLATTDRVAQAQLTFEIAQSQARDVVFARLMGARLGGGDAGPASLRNGLDYALSRSLGLDLTGVARAPAVAAALSGQDAGGPEWSILQNEFADVTTALVSNVSPPPGALERLVAAAEAADAKTARPRLASAVLLLFALQPDAEPALRGRIAALGGAEGKASQARTLAMEWAAQQRMMGETALLALWTSLDASPASPAMGDRVRIVRALHLAGLEAEARAYAAEGLLALK